MISDKVHPHHLERKAMLYVRQSSAHQVLHNRESSACRYISHRRAEYYLASKCGCLAYSILTISRVLVSCTTRRRWQLRRNRDRRNPGGGYG